MADRVIKVTLLAQVGQYVSELQRAQQATEKTGTETDKLKTKQKNFETLAKGAVVFGGAITAVGMAALKTGIQYNTLQQTTRAALTTLLGSAKAANEQMDKLDAFARKSPFAKQVFIQAQQQMLGFGVEAKKVIPALDAIQNAVAAMGGGNDQIAAIADIMSRMNSEARLSGDSLQRLGYYGIDAAKLIGDSMGKTSAEIRDMARKPGGIPLDQVWDPLVNAMQSKFGGAADNVKQTFAGAMDRVKAAWRDFSSVLAEPLVGKNGGGALVDLLNWSADLMRAFIALPEPIKLTASAGVGLIGVVALLGGTAVLALPKIVAFRLAVATLKEESPLAAKALGGVGTAMRALGAAAVIGVALGAVWQLSDALKRQLEPSAEDVKNALVTAGSAVELLNKKSKVLTADLFGLRLKPVVENAKQLHEVLALSKKETEGFGGWFAAQIGNDDVHRAFGVLRDGWRSITEQMVAAPETITPRLKQMRDEYNLSAAEMMELIRLSPDLTAELTNQATAAGVSASKSNLLKIALGEIAPKTKEAATAQEVAAKSAADYSAALDATGQAAGDAAKAQEKWLETVAGADAAFVDLKGAYTSVVEKNKEIAQSTADATKNTKDSWKNFYDGVKVSLADYLTELEKQVAAQENWERNMLMLAGRVSAGTLTELARMGPEGAPLVAELVNASDAELARFDTAVQKRTAAAMGTFATTLDQAKPVIEAATAKLGRAGAQKIIDELASGKKSVEQVMKEYGLVIRQYPLTVKVDTSQGQREVDRFIRNNQGRVIGITVHGTGDVVVPGAGGRLTRASGGIIPGTPSHSDNMLIYAASGEFVTRTAQAQKPGNRAVLEAMNSGMDFSMGGGYAAGGFVQPQYASPVVNVTAPSFDGMEITGRLMIGGDGLGTIIDGRIYAREKTQAQQVWGAVKNL